jgi:hypothetical protein
MIRIDLSLFKPSSKIVWIHWIPFLIDLLSFISIYFLVHIGLVFFLALIKLFRLLYLIFQYEISFEVFTFLNLSLHLLRNCFHSLLHCNCLIRCPMFLWHFYFLWSSFQLLYLFIFIKVVKIKAIAYDLKSNPQVEV